MRSAGRLSFISVFIRFVIYALLKKLTRKALKVRTVEGKSMKTFLKDIYEKNKVWEEQKEEKLTYTDKRKRTTHTHTQGL